MSRLPTPGADSGNWGDILNDFLNQAHNNDGTIKTGAVSKSAVGLGNVNNTADVDKPISTATQTALTSKADLSTGIVPNSQLPSRLSDASLTAAFARLPGPLGGWKYKLATDPANAKIVILGDSTSDGGTGAGTMYRRLYGLHCQQGEALEGLGSADAFSDGVANGTTTFTSATANFTSDDVGRSINGKNITVGTVITAVTDAATVTLNQTVTSGTGLIFRVGRHIISGGNNGRPLLDWNASPSTTFPTMPYSRDRLVADAPHLVVVSWLINDIRLGLLGTTTDTCFTAGRARLKSFIDWLQTALPNTDILLRIPNTFLSADVGDVGHPTPYHFVTDGQGNINPVGLAQIYSTALRRIYLSFIGQYPNVDVLDTQADVFGSRTLDAHPLLVNQLHPTTSTANDVSNLTPVGGGYVAIADAIAKRIGFARNAFPVTDEANRTRTEFIVYDAPSAGTVRLMSRNYNVPASQAAAFRADTFYVNGMATPYALTSVTIDRTFGVNYLTLSGGSLTGIDFSSCIGKTAMISGSHPPATTGDRQQVFIDLPSIAAGATVTQNVTVTGAALGQNGWGTAVVASPGGSFTGSGLLLVGCYVQAADTVRLIIQNPTAGAIDVTGESWTFWIVR